MRFQCKSMCANALFRAGLLIINKSEKPNRWQTNNDPNHRRKNLISGHFIGETEHVNLTQTGFGLIE